MIQKFFSSRTAAGSSHALRPLAGRRCREQDLRRSGSELPHQVLRTALGQMLRNFKASSQVESIRRYLELAAEISWSKAFGWKQQRRWIEIIAIESDDFLYSLCLEFV